MCREILRIIQDQIEIYLIITTDAIQSSGILGSFISFKKSQGFNVNVVAIESNDIQSQSGRDLVKKIRSYLINHIIYQIL